jgi:hypothetical protein
MNYAFHLSDNYNVATFAIVFEFLTICNCKESTGIELLNAQSEEMGTWVAFNVTHNLDKGRARGWFKAPATLHQGPNRQAHGGHGLGLGTLAPQNLEV